MRERTEQKADEVTGHAKAINRHYMTADKSAVQSEDSSQSESENTGVGRSQTFVKTNESKANVSALNGETGLEKGQSTITEKDVSDSEGDLENRVEGNGKIIEQGCDKGSDMEVNGIRETDGKTIVAKQELKKIHAPKRKAANEDNSQFPKNSGNYTCNEQGVKKRKKSKNKDCLNETEQKESDRNPSDEEIADDGVAERNEDNSQFLENSVNHTCNEKGAKKSRKRKNKDFFTEAKEKESDKNSTEVEIADNGVEEKNEDNSQFPENSRNHVCNEEGAKKSRKSKSKDLLSEAKQKKSDRDSSDRKIADDRVNEKKDKQSQVVERPELYRTENEKKRKKKKKIRKYDSPSPQKESGLTGVPEEKWKMEESVDFGTIKEKKKGTKERSSKPGN